MAAQFRVLGQIEVLVDGHALAVGHARQQSVLAVLLIEANRAVTVDQLVERVWDTAPTPKDPKSVLRTYLWHVRRALAAAGSVTVVRHVRGYKLVVDERDVDLYRFRDLLGRAGTASDDDHAAALIEHALSLWRGEPFAGLDVPWINAARQNLLLLRHTARLDLTDIQLRHGRLGALLAELMGQAAEHPLDERVTGQLMLALYRSGRQADALEHYRRIRRRLAEDLGTDPGAALQQLHQRILAVDPALTISAAVVNRGAVVPRQLPADPPVFTGRSRELALLGAALDERPEHGGPMVISAIGGMGGVGKSWLALRWAHRHADRFPDGQLWADLRGFDPSEQPTPPATAVRGFLDALGVTPEAMPAGLDARIGLYRSLVAGRRMLIVLDNARDSAQVVPLLPGSAECMVLVTSRHRLTGLVTAHGARMLDLGVLSQEDARQLLIDRLGRRRVAAEPEAVCELLDSCAGLPLALSITAARAGAQPDLTLATLATEIHDHAHRLDALDAGEPDADLRAVLSWSLRTLSKCAARALELLATAPGPDTSPNAAAALLALPTTETRTLLRELQRAHLLHQANDRYHMHDLVRLYAVELAREILAADHQAALHRIVSFYLSTADAASRLLTPNHASPSGHVATAGAIAQDLPDTASALAWFAAEHDCLLATQQAAYTHGWDTEVHRLAQALHPYHRSYGHRHTREAIATWRLALSAARRLGDPLVETQAREHLGEAYALIDMTSEALEQLHQALVLATQTGDTAGTGRAHFLTAWALGQRGEDVLALGHAYNALRAFQGPSDTMWRARALNLAGWFQARLGRYANALDTCQAALTQLRRHPIEHRRAFEAATLDSLGYIAHHLGDYDQAIDHYNRALSNLRVTGALYREPDVLEHLAETHLARGQTGQAHDAWKQALDLYRIQYRLTNAERVTARLADEAS